MYLMYVDESGDTGLENSPSHYFALSGLVVHELQWRTFISDLVRIRKTLKDKYGFGIREELHAAQFIRRNNLKLKKSIRLQILRDYAKYLAELDYISVTNILVNKTNKTYGYDVFDRAWEALFQRFENTLHHKNFPGPANPQDYGVIFCDDTNGRKLNSLIRKMAVYNPIPKKFGSGYLSKPIRLLIEDPNMRNSVSSLPIQAADFCAFMLYQHFHPNNYLKNKTGHGYFHHLSSILNKKASNAHPDGVVLL